MKKPVKIIVALIFVLGVIFAFSLCVSAETEGVFTYTVSNGEATLTACDKNVSGNIIIPSKLGGYPVTTIGYNAFSFCTSVESIVIPDSVTSITEYAFYGCGSLTSITIGNSVTSIGVNTFSRCYALDRVDIKNLEAWLNISFDGYDANPMERGAKLYINGKELAGEVVIPEGVTKIGDYAFAFYDYITSVTIPDSVKSIGNTAFNDCDSLISVTFGKGDITIDTYAFAYCDLLENITIGDGVKTIGVSAFYGSPGIKNVNVNSIETWLSIVFEDSTANPMNLATKIYVNGEELAGEVVIPKGVTKVGDYAFFGYNFIKSIIIPDSVRSIGSSAFESCYCLESVTIGNKVKTISASAFYCCGSLASVTIGNDVASIGNYAFYGCSIDTVNYIGSEEEWNKIKIGSYNGPLTNANIIYNDYIEVFYEMADGVLTILNDGDMEEWTTEAVVPWQSRKSEITSVVIEDGVTTIGAYAFRGCTGITSVVLPKTITTIGKNAFRGCSNLEKITIPKSVTLIDYASFTGCKKLELIYFGGSKDEWENLSIDSGNTYLTGANIYFFGISKDPDNDGKVMVADAVKVLKAVAGIDTADDEMIAAADFDGDGILTGKDVTYMLKYIARIIPGI